MCLYVLNINANLHLLNIMPLPAGAAAIWALPRERAAALHLYVSIRAFQLAHDKLP